MTVLSTVGLAMSFADRDLFRDVSFDVAERERVALVGANGTGKTTLFRLLTGELEPTAGTVVKSRTARLGYMEQHACTDSTQTVYDEMLSVFAPLIETEARLDEISSALQQGIGDRDALIAEQSRLHDAFQRQDGMTFRSRTRSALLGLGFCERDFGLQCGVLSGGQRSKLSLGKLLLSGAEILLLDEPTNHLDIDAVEWLEGFLKEYRGAVLMISHDRWFLDAVTTKTMDFSRGTLRVWNGAYSSYMQQKAARDAQEKRDYENAMAEIGRIEGIIAQQRQFGRERNFVTIASKEKMLERKRAELVVPESVQRTVHFRFPDVLPTGNEVLLVRNVSKAFADKRLFTGVTFQVNRGDRTFLLGANGCGKTTLLRILHGEETADAGSFRLGAGVKIGYFDQSLRGLHPDKTALDEVWDRRRTMTQTEIRSALALFLFCGEDVYKKVCELSGGEKARLALLALMLSGANFLVLDEPTNHLDVGSREALETALLSFGGTMLVVSHDRYFIRKLSTRILCLSADGVEETFGGYEAYAARRTAQEAHTPTPKKVNLYKLQKERESEKRRLDGKIRRCEQAIEDVEAQLTAANETLSAPETASDYEQILHWTAVIDDLHAQQTALMEQWEQLSTERETLD